MAGHFSFGLRCWCQFTKLKYTNGENYRFAPCQQNAGQNRMIRIANKPSKNVARSELFGNDSHISELYTMKTEAADCSETTVPIYGTPAMHPHTCSRIRNLQSGITASRLAMWSIPNFWTAYFASGHPLTILNEWLIYWFTLRLLQQSPH